MTKLLEKAITKVNSLSPDKQDFIASVILEELEDDMVWGQAFKESQPQLTKLAEKVRGDIKAGKAKVKNGKLMILSKMNKTKNIMKFAGIWKDDNVGDVFCASGVLLNAISCFTFHR